MEKIKDLYNEMEQDKYFMKWLKKYLVDYKSDYDENVLNMYEAYLEGRRIGITRF